jgi:ribosomal-protein-alanine N-acetyltransferase
VDAAASASAALAAESLFLEVAVDNAAAIGLYRAAGFTEAGRRRGYYTKTEDARVDALIMRRDLNRAPA